MACSNIMDEYVSRTLALLTWLSGRCSTKILNELLVHIVKVSRFSV